MPAGRPRVYDRQVADQILELLADGQSLQSICSQNGFPARSTVHIWVIDDVDGFSARYARARVAQAHALADDTLDIADDGRNDWVQSNDPDNPGYRLNGEHIQRSRLRWDARRWAASKILPKVYGDKIEHEHTGEMTVHKVIAERPMTEEEWTKAHAPDDAG